MILGPRLRSDDRGEGFREARARREGLGGRARLARARRLRAGQNRREKNPGGPSHAGSAVPRPAR